MKFRKGDTLVEVMLAMSIFASVMMIGLSLMNNGMSRALGNLQLTMARNAMDSQAEALRFMNAAYISEYQAGSPNPKGAAASQWVKNITLNDNVSSSATNLSDCSRPAGNKAFVISRNNITVRRDNIINAQTFPMVLYGTSDSNTLNLSENYASAKGIWVEAVRPTSADYYDFHIRACWAYPGSNTNMTLGTIVRLYDPRG